MLESFGTDALQHLLGERFPCPVSTRADDSPSTLLVTVAGKARWTIAESGGIARLTNDVATRPRSAVATDPATLTDLLTGRRTIVEAVVDGDVRTRGSLSTVLQLGAALAPPADRATRARPCAVSVADVHTAYLEAGPVDAPPVVLLHGLGGSNASMLPLLADLATDHRVLAPDIPGFGASAAPRWTYTADRLCRWLQSFLLATDTHRPVLVGNSLGGRLALELAIHAPNAVREMVLLCPSPAFRRFRQLVPLARRMPVDVAVLPRPRLPRMLVTACLRSMFARPDRLPQHWFETAVDEFETAMRHDARRRAALSALLNIYIEEPFGVNGFWHRLRSVRTPTLFVWGARDRLVPAGFARHVTAAIPTAESVVVPDCGHLPQLELPDLTARLTRRFLAAHPTHCPNLARSERDLREAGNARVAV